MTTITEEATEAVRVKPLEWDGAMASCGFGAYTVAENSDDTWSFTYHSYPYGEPEGGYESEASAKSAAQSDYEARIRSALIAPQAEGRDTGATAAIVEKLTSMARLLDTGPVHGPACAEIVREAIRALSPKEPEQRPCPYCHGKGTEADYVGPEMKPYASTCSHCNGEGVDPDYRAVMQENGE